MTGPFLRRARTSTVSPLALASTIAGALSPPFSVRCCMAPVRSCWMWRSMAACRSGGTRLYQPARYSASCSFNDIKTSSLLMLHQQNSAADRCRGLAEENLLRFLAHRRLCVDLLGPRIGALHRRAIGDRLEPALKMREIC